MQRFGDNQTEVAVEPIRESSWSAAHLHPWAALHIAGSIAADRERRTRDAPKRRTSAGASAQLHVATEGWSVSLVDFLEHLDVQGLIANDLLESIILFLEHLQSLGFLTLHAAVLASPARQGCLTDFERLQHFANALAGREHRVGISQLLDDLLG